MLSLWIKHDNSDIYSKYRIIVYNNCNDFCKSRQKTQFWYWKQKYHLSASSCIRCTLVFCSR